MPRLAVLSGVLVSGLAAAHAVGLSRSSWHTAPGHVTAQVVLATGELMALSAESMAKHTAQSVAVPGCTLAASSGREVEGDGVEVTLQFDCPGEEPKTADLSALLAKLGPSHRHLVQLGEEEVVLSAGQALLTLRARGAARTSGWAMVAIGVTHILKGPDHLLFLLGLLVAVRRWKPVVGLVTAFTLGHSISLAVASFGLFVPSPRFVEPLIALSLVWVGVENVVRKELTGRWRLTLAFGLIHGFGFASALRELQVPRERLPLALLCFNGGVEVGQLMVLAVVLPVLLWAHRWKAFEVRGVRGLSLGVAAAGAVWFVIRVIG